MHALRLITRHLYDGVEEEVALLVYDSATLSGTMLSDDVRDHFNQRPITRRVYILAPFIDSVSLKRLLFEASLFDRVRVVFKSFSGEISMLTFDEEGEKKIAVSIPFSIGTDGKVVEKKGLPIPENLRSGWLFSLFDANRGLVNAPSGVHFGKGSKKHATKFLRVSSILLTSEACALISYFTLASSTLFQPRRIFVDTAPLISVAFALQRIAVIHGIWGKEVPVSSFSSYGGVDRLPLPSRRDIVLISASTSGGLVELLIGKGFSAEAVLLLFYLGKNSEPKPKFPAVCDLTFRKGSLYGYTEIENYSASACPLCEKGYFLAALEGDQFMLESRAVKELVVRTKNQPKEARDTVERLARNHFASVPIFAQGAQRFEIEFDFAAALKSIEIKSRGVQLLRRYTPMPLNYIVLADTDEEMLNLLLADSNLADYAKSAKIVRYSDLRSAEKIAGAGVLVFVACLKDYTTVRDINAELRSVAEGGCIAYISALTLAESPEQLAALRTFLTYGANGKDSFTFVSANTLMLPFGHDERSSWEVELEFLRKMIDAGNSDPEVQARVDVLLGASNFVENLFWPGKNGELRINNDFVYLDTADNREAVSQADLYLVVSNLLASARINDRGIASPSQNDPVRWQQSVYGQTLLSVTNFEDYNDSVLRAAFLRVASSTELNFSSHVPSSSRVLEIIRQGLVGWKYDMGDFLPEFFVALATQRLILTDSDTVSLKNLVNTTELPTYLKNIAQQIP
jgi:hypothetical protein